ncbi:hypothetical protein PPO43_16090 (plasmid) [Saprospira sp. CCB-QB6]|uniref:hypothetical protein n=1 Tax=Saprospira sp. CCB-QB6 TaxID=3023936 RepID=UPI00234BC46F|nr:hypothetical protein [Saprospira sp. CCB-QB6]WCL83130.1 hypothetical protein PPO43_16090 [Saprospira sp. CCB-QB6]
MKIRLAIGLALFLSASPLFAQFKAAYKALKKGEVEEAITLFEARILDPKAYIGVEAEYQLARIFANPKYAEFFDLGQAFQYAKSAERRYNTLDDKSIRKLQKNKLSHLQIEGLQLQLLQKAQAQAEKENSYAAYQQLLENFKFPSQSHREHIEQARNQRAWILAQMSNDFRTYERYFRKHQASLDTVSPKEDSLFQMALLDSYTQLYGWSSYGNFEERFPKNKAIENEQAAEDFIKIANSSNIRDFETYRLGYPKGYWSDLAYLYIYRLSMQKADIFSLDAFARTHKDYVAQKESFWQSFWQVYKAAKGPEAKEEFLQNYPIAQNFKLNW